MYAQTLCTNTLYTVCKFHAPGEALSCLPSLTAQCFSKCLTIATCTRPAFQENIPVSLRASLVNNEAEPSVDEEHGTTDRHFSADGATTNGQRTRQALDIF